MWADTAGRAAASGSGAVAVCRGSSWSQLMFWFLALFASEDDAFVVAHGTDTMAFTARYAGSSNSCTSACTDRSKALLMRGCVLSQGMTPPHPLISSPSAAHCP